MEALQDRLESAAQVPARPPYPLSSLIQEIRLQKGRPVLVVEIAQPSPSSTPEDVGRLAKQLQGNGMASTRGVQYAGWGADALAVLTDLEATSSGYADLVAACRAAKVPVLQRDWVLHPLQIVDAKEAGAGGVLGTIASVSVRATPVLSSFAAAVGLDAPVEVVNKMEVEAMASVGVPFFGINLAVGLSLALPGFKSDITKGLLGALPQGASSLVGVTSIEEAVKAHAAGADSLLIKREMLADAEKEGKVEELLERLKRTLMVSVLAQDAKPYNGMNGERKQPWALELHDKVNIAALPVLGGLCALSLLGYYEGAKVTNVFLLYIIADFLWIYFQPETLPSLHQVILGHHVVTLLLLLFPYRYPAFARFTCWDGITEINTFFLIARRQFPALYKPLHYAYWISFIPMRLILYPYMLVRFWVVLDEFPLYERLPVVLCQFLLCCFNYGMFWLSIRRRLVKRSKKQVSTAQVPAVNRCTDRRNVRGELQEKSSKENGVKDIRAEAASQEILKSR
ncbi:hypothetical protein COCSUDRAFT_47639 [Coccomyxa subellipsoidea C-169]|uniref:indole-3-glycerol-phosphate synthase n=1 Tax=Coccomyxa subellipsoidea (strain C-169) TaxID=574566 RepID=I0YW85_COCSC|nr:hypothetical protein COCSUDRAFT_47639 [Coccomyxa subellipsoidea C-169]EIE22654.1 hypothetical protein COCSUDRAFT_47639 [Coccomyxa subellipsoidea C-169]|eukprot:XP_005647198.1 hypothetical protein COCSUDRAFT_47639 [Coccomyxa subellipsoidea C-169]